MSPARLSICFAALLAVPPQEVAAQRPRDGVVLVGVADGQTGAPIASAEVRLSTVARSARTDWLGRAAFSGVRRGMHRVSVRALGYGALTAPIAVKDLPGDTVEAVVFLDRAVTTLDTVMVVEQPMPVRLREVETRRRLAFGQYLTAEQLDGEWGRPLADVLAVRFTGLRSTSDSTMRLRLYSTRSTGIVTDTFPNRCPVDVYVNGVYVEDGDLELPPTTWVAAVEYYAKTTAPPEYRRAGVACGVLLVWLK